MPSYVHQLGASPVIETMGPVLEHQHKADDKRGQGAYPQGQKPSLSIHEATSSKAADSRKQKQAADEFTLRKFHEDSSAKMALN